MPNNNITRDTKKVFFANSIVAVNSIAATTITIAHNGVLKTFSIDSPLIKPVAGIIQCIDCGSFDIGIAAIRNINNDIVETVPNAVPQCKTCNSIETKVLTENQE